MNGPRRKPRSTTVAEFWNPTGSRRIRSGAPASLSGAHVGGYMRGYRFTAHALRLFQYSEELQAEGGCGELRWNQSQSDEAELPGGECRSAVAGDAPGDQRCH